MSELEKYADEGGFVEGGADESREFDRPGTFCFDGDPFVEMKRARVVIPANIIKDGRRAQDFVTLFGDLYASAREAGHDHETSVVEAVNGTKMYCIFSKAVCEAGC